MSKVLTLSFTMLMIFILAFCNSLSEGVHSQVLAVGLTRSLKLTVVSPMEYVNATCLIRLNQDLAALSVVGLGKVGNVLEDLLTGL